MSFSTYDDIRRHREKQIRQASRNHVQLNQFHDDLYQHVLAIALSKITNQLGSPPCSFSFFVMGSAGRSEQSVWSDQDHGIIYKEQGKSMQDYFLALGTEVSQGLFQAGYPYCEGGVMASHPLWCQSLPEWQQQLYSWAAAPSWETIRCLLIFIDGRTFYGDHSLLYQLKAFFYRLVETEQLLGRIYDNTVHHKKGVGLLGQLLVETHGVNSGSINFKETALFPFVNSVRLLAIKENLLETSTLSRLDRLPLQNREFYKQQFLKLLNFRLTFANHETYDSSHFLSVRKLTKAEKIDLRETIKTGEKLTQIAKRLVEKENQNGKV